MATVVPMRSLATISSAAALLTIALVPTPASAGPIAPDVVACTGAFDANECFDEVVRFAQSVCHGQFECIICLDFEESGKEIDLDAHALIPDPNPTGRTI